jgi:hypothetical protein
MRSVTKADVARRQAVSRPELIVEEARHESKTPKIEKPPITPVKLDPTRRSEFAKAISTCR